MPVTESIWYTIWTNEFQEIANVFARTFSTIVNIMQHSLSVTIGFVIVLGLIMKWFVCTKEFHKIMNVSLRVFRIIMQYSISLTISLMILIAFLTKRVITFIR